MFSGSNRPTKNQIFGPSNVGGTLADSRERQLYMTGEGLGSFFGSLFRKIIPAATKTIKKIAGSKIVKDTGKQLLNSSGKSSTFCCLLSAFPPIPILLDLLCIKGKSTWPMANSQKCTQRSRSYHDKGKQDHQLL